MNQMTNPNWPEEAELLEERIEELEKRENATNWVLTFMAIAIFALALKVVLV